MRRSVGSLAYIRRRKAGRVELLTQWSTTWHAFHFVGGHKRSTETFWECLVREVSEELGIAEEVDFRVIEPALGRLEFTAWSESARVETAYTLTLFLVELIGDHTEARLSPAPENRWLTTHDIARGCCLDGLAISSTLNFILDRLPSNAIDPSDEPPLA